MAVESKHFTVFFYKKFRKKVLTGSYYRLL